MNLWIIAGMVLGFLVLLFLSKVKVIVYYQRRQKNDHAKIEVGLLNGLIPIRKEISVMQSDPDGFYMRGSWGSKDHELPQKETHISPREMKNQLIKIWFFRKRLRLMVPVIKRFLAKMTVQELRLVSRFGTGDAARTAMAFGLFWGVAGMMVSLLKRYVQVKAAPQIRLVPSFERKGWDAEVECIVQFRLGNAILAGFQLWKISGKGRELDGKPSH